MLETPAKRLTPFFRLIREAKVSSKFWVLLGESQQWQKTAAPAAQSCSLPSLHPAQPLIFTIKHLPLTISLITLCDEKQPQTHWKRVVMGDSVSGRADRTQHLIPLLGQPQPQHSTWGTQWAGSTLKSTHSAKVRSNLCPTDPEFGRRVVAQSQPCSLLHSSDCRPGHRKGHVNPCLGDDLFLWCCSYRPCLCNRRKHFMLPKYYIAQGGW